MQYLLERMEAAGPTEIRVVTRPEKVDVIRFAQRRGAHVLEEHPATTSASILAGTADLDVDDVVLIGFPDTIWEPLDGFLRLLELVHGGAAAALGLFSMSEPERGEVVETKRDGTVRAIHVRPAAPHSNRIWGCAALRAGVLRGLRADAHVGSALACAARSRVIRGIDLSDFYVDVGTPVGLAEARRRVEERSTNSGRTPRRV
jgi:dTDP-glucose pyrophosphorylase